MAVKHIRVVSTGPDLKLFTVKLRGIWIVHYLTEILGYAIMLHSTRYLYIKHLDYVQLKCLDSTKLLVLVPSTIVTYNYFNKFF